MRLALIAALMLSSTAAWAAPVQTDTDADAAARRKAPAKTGVTAQYDFENDNVTGRLDSPDHEGVRTKQTTRHESMIQLRIHFIPQMLQMAHDV
jgi:hypothetical protein